MSFRLLYFRTHILHCTHRLCARRIRVPIYSVKYNCRSSFRCKLYFFRTVFLADDGCAREALHYVHTSQPSRTACRLLFFLTCGKPRTFERQELLPVAGSSMWPPRRDRSRFVYLYSPLYKILDCHHVATL